MYLRRFAVQTKKADRIAVRHVDDYSTRFVANIDKIAKVQGFYWSVDETGEPSHGVEDLLMVIEEQAARAFRVVLDDDPDYALTAAWPPSPADRLAIAWWLSAQIVRTTRQRARVEHLARAKGVPPMAAPPEVAKFAQNHAHLEFMLNQMSKLAAVIYARPWGLGFADHCLLTSDVPVVVTNDHDADDQLLVVSVWDVICPLDPHRLLFLPGVGNTDSPGTDRDHRSKFTGMLGAAINQLVFDAADRHVFHHPDHPPPVPPNSDHRLPRPWDGDHREPAQFLMSYAALRNNQTIERRWLTEHPPRS